VVRIDGLEICWLVLAPGDLLKNDSSMVDKQNKSQGGRIALGVIITLGMFGEYGLMAASRFDTLATIGVLTYSLPLTYLCALITIPSGVFYFLLLGTATSFFLIGRYMYKKFLRKDQVWHQYRLDTFFWAEWQWDYTWKGEVTNLWCECEKCAERMKPKVVPDGADGHGVRFICNHCGKQSTTIKSTESEQEALDRVEKKIMRKIRVGKFRGGIEGKMLEGDDEQSF